MATIDVGTQYNNMQVVANNVLGQADGFLANLLLQSNVFFGDPFNIDALLPNAYNYASVPQVFIPIVAGGIRPDLSHLSPSGVIPAPPTFQFQAPPSVVMPVDDLLTPTNSFSYAEGAYDRSLLDPWRAKLLSDLQNGGYGIDTNDEIALLNRTRDREVETMLTRFEEAGRAMASRGFPLPPGELAIQFDRAVQDMQNKVSDTNREIYIDRAKRFVDNRQFTIVQVKEMENILIGFYNAVQERAINVSKLTVQMAIEIYNTILARFKARLEFANSNWDAQYKLNQIQVDQQRLYLESFRAQIEAYLAQLRTVTDVARVQVEAYGIDIQADRVLNDGQVAVASLQQEVLKSTVQQNIQIDMVAIETAKAKLLATSEALQFRLETSKFASEKFFAYLTTLVGSVQALGVQTQAT